MIEFKVDSKKFPNRRWFGETVKGFEKFINNFSARIEQVEVIGFEEITTLPEGVEDRDNGIFILDPKVELTGFQKFLNDTDRVWSVIEKLQSFRKELERSIPMKKETSLFSGFGSSAGMQVLVPDLEKISKEEIDTIKILINKFQEKQDFLLSFVSGE